MHQVMRLKQNTEPLLYRRYYTTSDFCGSNPYTVNAGKVYDDLSVGLDYEANPDLSIAGDISNVIISQLGTYSVIYTATDVNGLNDIKYRTVVVEDNTTPVFNHPGKEYLPNLVCLSETTTLTYSNYTLYADATDNQNSNTQFGVYRGNYTFNITNPSAMFGINNTGKEDKIRVQISSEPTIIYVTNSYVSAMGGMWRISTVDPRVDLVPDLWI